MGTSSCGQFIFVRSEQSGVLVKLPNLMNFIIRFGSKHNFFCWRISMVRTSISVVNTVQWPKTWEYLTITKSLTSQLPTGSAGVDAKGQPSPDWQDDHDSEHQRHLCQFQSRNLDKSGTLRKVSTESLPPLENRVSKFASSSKAESQWNLHDSKFQLYFVHS